MQIESNTKYRLPIFIAEMLLILCKDKANRAEKQHCHLLSATLMRSDRFVRRILIAEISIFPARLSVSLKYAILSD